MHATHVTIRAPMSNGLFTPNGLFIVESSRYGITKDRVSGGRQAQVSEARPVVFDPNRGRGGPEVAALGLDPGRPLEKARRRDAYAPQVRPGVVEGHPLQAHSVRANPYPVDPAEQHLGREARGDTDLGLRRRPNGFLQPPGDLVLNQRGKHQVGEEPDQDRQNHQLRRETPHGRPGSSRGSAAPSPGRKPSVPGWGGGWMVPVTREPSHRLLLERPTGCRARGGRTVPTRPAPSRCPCRPLGVGRQRRRAAPPLRGLPPTALPEPPGLHSRRPPRSGSRRGRGGAWRASSAASGSGCRAPSPSGTYRLAPFSCLVARDMVASEKGPRIARKDDLLLVHDA